MFQRLQSPVAELVVCEKRPENRSHPIPSIGLGRHKQQHWRNSILVLVYKVKCDLLGCGLYRAIKLLEQPMKVIERVLEKRVSCQLTTCSLASCLVNE